MKRLSLPSNLEEKVYDIKYLGDKNNLLITSYFPLSEEEKQVILDKLKTHTIFKSIFSDTISESDWTKSKKQIKKKFQNELFYID